MVQTWTDMAQQRTVASYSVGVEGNVQQYVLARESSRLEVLAADKKCQVFLSCGG